MRNTLLAASLLALTLSTASAADVSASDALATQTPVIEYVVQASAAPVIVTADLQGTVYDIINFGYKYLPDPPWLGLVDVIFG